MDSNISYAREYYNGVYSRLIGESLGIRVIRSPIILVGFVCLYWGLTWRFWKESVTVVLHFCPLQCFEIQVKVLFSLHHLVVLHLSLLAFTFGITTCYPFRFSGLCFEVVFIFFFMFGITVDGKIQCHDNYGLHFFC